MCALCDGGGGVRGGEGEKCVCVNGRERRGGEGEKCVCEWEGGGKGQDNNSENTQCDFDNISTFSHDLLFSSPSTHY